MSTSIENKIAKLEKEFAASRSQKQKCSLLIDIAMELRNSDPDKALDYSKQARAIAEPIGFLSATGRCYFCNGLIFFNLSEYEKAIVSLNRAYQIFLGLGDKWGISNSLNNMGLVYLKLGDYAKALNNFSSSLQIKKESRDRFGTANVLISMSFIHRETGSYSDAELLLNQSLQIASELNSEELQSKGLVELGIVLLADNKPQEAILNFDLAKDIFEKHNNRNGIAKCLLNIGKLKSSGGDSDGAILLFIEGKKISDESGDRSLSAVFLYSIAEEQLKYGKIQESIMLLKEAAEIAIQTQEKPMQSRISKLLSEGYEATDRLKDSLREYKNYVTLRQEISSTEAATQLRNLQISAKVELLQNENKILEFEKSAAINQLTAVLNAQEIKSLNAMMDGQEKERKRIAADLHDRIGGSLAAIKLHLTGFIQLQLSELQTQDRIVKVNEMFDEVMKEVRRVSHDLASGVLIRFGIVSALAELCRSIESAGSIKVNFFSGGFEERIDHKTEISLYRITQELLTNILKHANAREINIHLNRYETLLSLGVEDDGVGFDTSKDFDGIGMSNIKARVNQIQGSVFFDSSPGNGCAVTIEVPINTVI
jgi:signal transduction histidine kinase